MYKNIVVITFITERELTEDEQENLTLALSPQVEEPVNSDMEDEEYETSEVEVKHYMPMRFGKPYLPKPEAYVRERI